MSVSSSHGLTSNKTDDLPAENRIQRKQKIKFVELYKHSSREPKSTWKKHVKLFPHEYNLSTEFQEISYQGPHLNKKKPLWPPSQSVNEKKLTLFLLRGCLNSSCTFFGSLLFLLGLLTKEIHIIVIVILGSLKTNIQIPPISNNTYRFYKANLNKFKATIESKSPT